jgi:hypothetical protein
MDLRKVYKSEGAEGPETLREMYRKDTGRFMDRMIKLEEIVGKQRQAAAQIEGLTSPQEARSAPDAAQQRIEALISELLAECEEGTA